MLKKLLTTLVFFIAGTGLSGLPAMQSAVAATASAATGTVGATAAAVATTKGVDVNLADGPALDGIKGIGPVMLKRILEARAVGGKFRNWDDFQDRVTGVGPKSSIRLSENGLTIDGRSKFDDEAPVAPAAVVGKTVGKSAGGAVLNKAAGKTAEKSVRAILPGAAAGNSV